MQAHVPRHSFTHTLTIQEPSLQSGCSLLQSLEFDPVLDVLYGASGSGRVTHISWSPATAYDGEDSVKLQ